MAQFIVSGLVLRYSHRPVIVAIVVSVFLVAITVKVNPSDNNHMDFVREANGSSLDDRFIHKHEYKLSLNNDTICDSDTFLLILVNSDPEHRVAREIIRETWGSVRMYNRAHIRVVFLVGNRLSPKTEPAADLAVQLKVESETYGDIVKGDFIDAYVNMTYKTVMGLKWMKQYCPKASFVMKSDDDVMINIHKVVHFLQEIDQSDSNLSNFFYCLTITSSPFRATSSKWYVSYSDYKYNMYPTYCAGAGYIISNRAAVRVFEATTKVPYYWIDDVYIGFCAELSNIKLINNYFGYYFIVPHSATDAPWDCSILKVIGRDREESLQTWAYLKSIRNFHNMTYYRILAAFLITCFCLCICLFIVLLMYVYRFCKLKT